MIKSNTVHFLVCFALFFSSAYASDEPTLCTSKEKTFFSCATAAKVISICATQGMTLETGQLTYRFGKPNDKPELVYPKKASPVKDTFKYCYDGYAKGSTGELSFTIGKYSYTLHVDKHVFRDDASGVFVEKGSDIVAYLSCNKAFQEEDLYELEKIGIEVCQPRGIGTPRP